MNWNPLSKRNLLVAAVLAAILTQATCGGGSSSSTATITSISVSPSSASVGINVTTDFTATVTLTNGTSSTSTAVTWQVNCISGGNSSIGTITSSPDDNQIGVYTAPGIVPSTNNGVVTISASAPQTGTTSTACSTADTISSNTSSVAITVETGVNITPVSAKVPAAGSYQFTALQNNLPDNNATWSVSSSLGGDVGTIDPTGLYTAPLFPPPGDLVTISAQDGTVTATATATITYSDASLYGPFAFSYSGGTGDGFAAVAGSFVADGQGNIVSGVEDIDGFSTGTAAQVPIYSGNYVVQPDGRTSVTLNTSRQTGVTWQFALTDNQHAPMILFNKNAGGSGSIAQQNLNDLTASDNVLLACGQSTCPYVFGASGSDVNFNPLATAGRFNVNGSGQIPQSGTLVDVNDNGTVTKQDTSLSGSFAFDTVYDGTGRGTITLTSSTANHLFAFYVVDSTHLKLVEIDANGYLSGDMYSAPTGSSFNTSLLSASNYVFTALGSSSAGGYAAGGVFVSDGGGNVTGGAFDNNNAGTLATDQTFSSCPYTVDSSTGRIDLQVCPSGGTASEFAAYPTDAGDLVLVEIDANAISRGMAYPQTILAIAGTVQAPVDGSFALNLGALAISSGATAGNPQSLEGQATLTGGAITGGHLDINNFNAVYQNDPVNTAGSSMTAPDATLGRGTATLAASDPAASYSLVYYVIDNNRALLLDQDTVRVGIGIASRQY